MKTKVEDTDEAEFRKFCLDFMHALQDQAKAIGELAGAVHALADSIAVQISADDNEGLEEYEHEPMSKSKHRYLDEV